MNYCCNIENNVSNFFTESFVEVKKKRKRGKNVEKKTMTTSKVVVTFTLLLRHLLLIQLIFFTFHYEFNTLASLIEPQP